MGLTRQAVQRLVDDMRADGFVRLEPNPHHRRAMLVLATERGGHRLSSGHRTAERWADALTAGLSAEAFEAASALLCEMQRRIEGADPAAAIEAQPQTQGA